MTYFSHSHIAQKLAVLAVSLLFTFPTFSQNEYNDLNQKLLMGYQGWFLAVGDNSPPNEWRHWFNSLTDPSAANLNIDMWPDMREYTQTYPTNMTYGDGATAQLFSSYDESTVITHFKWMKDYGIHGVYLQRFLGEAVNDPRFFQVRNKVLQNVMTAAQTHGRQFAVMYDLSGVPDDGNLYNKLINDWEYLVQNYQMTTQGTYLKQENLPVIALWGIGFNERGLKPDTFAQIIDYFQNSAPPAYRAYVVGGVPGEWRTLTGDSETDTRWAQVYRSLDMISPWTVGRYTNNTEADNWKNQRIVPDMAAAAASGVDYMPVIWPGFSWYNLHDGPLNQIPRNGGQFYWRQAYNALDAGAEFIYVAMFDEVDEATAMFKLAETSSDIPAQGNFVTLDADGTDLPSDWYLRLAGETQKILAGSAPLSATIPISPLQTPFGGTPWTIPGTIEMENFDNGGEGVAYHDVDAANNGNAGRTNEGVDTENASGGGLNVGWTSSGEWLEYTVNVATSGTYDLEFRVASIFGGGNFHVQFDGDDKTGLIPTSNTGGWQTWTSVTAENVVLDAGEQVMRIYLDNANFNLDNVIITPANSNPPDDDPVAYRIRNVWQNSYLGDGGATVIYSSSPGSANFEWQLEEVAGGVQEIRNRATGDYMHIENLTGNIQCTTRTNGWSSSRWHIADAGNGQVRIRNAWQGNDYIHVENLNGNAQHGGIYMEWSSAKWVLEAVD